MDLDKLTRIKVKEIKGYLRPRGLKVVRVEEEVEQEIETSYREKFHVAGMSIP